MRNRKNHGIYNDKFLLPDGCSLVYENSRMWYLHEQSRSLFLGRLINDQGKTKKNIIEQENITTKNQVRKE